MEIQVKSFTDLSTKELYELLALRAEVFVVEQDCVYQDPDGKDYDALHVMIKKDGQITAYARVFGPGYYFKEASIGRIVVRKKARSAGLGKKVVLAAQEAIWVHFKTDTIKLSAQSYLREFYEKLGYKMVGEQYLEDGIPHIAMVKNPIPAE